MSYQDELQARLDAVRSPSPHESVQKIDTVSLQGQLIKEIESEFELSQYYLDESDILRSIKILDILHGYGEAFTRPKSLALFYALAKADMITPKALMHLCELKSSDFKTIINEMAKAGLIRVNADKELELTLAGQSLAERIGFDVFI